MHFISSHKRQLFLLIPALALLLVLAAILNPSYLSSTETQRYHAALLEEMEQSKTFKEFTDALFRYEVTSDSITTAYTLKTPEKQNIPTLIPTLTSFSYKDYLADSRQKNDDTTQFVSECLSRFASADLTEEEKLTYTLLQNYIASNSALSEYPFYEHLLGSSSGIQANLPVTLGEYPLRTEADVETYLLLLKQIPDYFENVISYEKHRGDIRLTTPAFLTSASLESTKTMLSGFENGDNSFIDTFNERIIQIDSLSDKQIDAYRKQNQAYVEKYVIPAYENLLAYFEETLAEDSTTLINPDTPYGLVSLPKGADYYSILTKSVTGSSKTVPELITMTEQSLENALGTVMNVALADQDAYFYYCENPVTSYYESPEAILEALSLMIRENYPLLSDTPSYQIKMVPDSLATSLSPAFYMIPAIDDYQNNTIYINQLYTNEENGNLFTTLAHEGFPGHLYQTVYFNESSPAAIRQQLNYPGYVEGWATYVEMDSFHFLEYPMESDSLCKLYQAETIINLALCSRIDMGVNFEGWTLNDTKAFFEENGFNDYYAEDVYTYVVETPANYLSYFIGYLEITELKDAYQRQEMENYSEKDFHKKLLDIGPADFETIRNYLLK